MSKAAYPLKLPMSIKKAAQRLAKEDWVSLNQWIAVSVAEKVGVVETGSGVLPEARRSRNRGPADEVSPKCAEGPTRTRRRNPLSLMMAASSGCAALRAGSGALASLHAGDDGRQRIRAQVVSGVPHPLEGRRSRRVVNETVAGAWGSIVQDLQHGLRALHLMKRHRRFPYDEITNRCCSACMPAAVCR